MSLTTSFFVGQQQGSAAYVQFDESFGSKAFLDHLLHLWDTETTPLRAADFQGHTFKNQARLNAVTREIEFPCLRRVKGKGDTWEPTGTWYPWAALAAKNPLAVKPPPADPRLYAKDASLPTASAAGRQAKRQPSSQQSKPVPDLLSRLSPVNVRVGNEAAKNPPTAAGAAPAEETSGRSKEPAKEPAKEKGKAEQTVLVKDAEGWYDSIPISKAFGTSSSRWSVVPPTPPPASQPRRAAPRSTATSSNAIPIRKPQSIQSSANATTVSSASPITPPSTVPPASIEKEQSKAMDSSGMSQMTALLANLSTSPLPPRTSPSTLPVVASTSSSSPPHASSPQPATPIAPSVATDSGPTPSSTTVKKRWADDEDDDDEDFPTLAPSPTLAKKPAFSPVLSQTPFSAAVAPSTTAAPSSMESTLPEKATEPVRETTPSRTRAGRGASSVNQGAVFSRLAGGILQPRGGGERRSLRR